VRHSVIGHRDVGAWRRWQRRGKRAEVRQLLPEMYGWLTEVFDTADLQGAKMLLEELA
jgi:adenylate cyclase